MTGEGELSAISLQWAAGSLAGDRGGPGTGDNPISCCPMQTRYLIIASLITALVILIAGAWWFYTRAI